MTIFHIWLDSKLVALILGRHPETADNSYLLCCQFPYVHEASKFFELAEFSENQLYCPSA